MEDDKCQINELEVCDVEIGLESPLVVSSDLSVLRKIVLIKNKNICGNGLVIQC